MHCTYPSKKTCLKNDASLFNRDVFPCNPAPVNDFDSTAIELYGGVKPAPQTSFDKAPHDPASSIGFQRNKSQDETKNIPNSRGDSRADILPSPCTKPLSIGCQPQYHLETKQHVHFLAFFDDRLRTTFWPGFFRGTFEHH